MQPTPINNSSFSIQGHSPHVYQILNGLGDDQLRFLLAKHMPNSPSANKHRTATRTELFQQCIFLIDTFYSKELQETLISLAKSNFPFDIHRHEQIHNFQRSSSPAITSVRSNLNSQISKNFSKSISQNPQTSTLSQTANSFVIAPTESNVQRTRINQIVLTNLPFYRTITCVLESLYIFQYDQNCNMHTSRNEFILPVDICNQLSLSYEFDKSLNTYKTSKFLILRLLRIDQPPLFNNKYEDNLPPNLSIQINGQCVTNLPIPKVSKRPTHDVQRVGREIDITQYCMFNPMLKNQLIISWFYSQTNHTLRSQYYNAQYGLHIYLVDRLTIDDLQNQIIYKKTKFYRQDLINLLIKMNKNDQDLEISNQKLKLICPIDKRRLKIPVRATTCQHLQCFDFRNYIMLNEKSNKWMCPVCNRQALFENIQIDTYTQSILNSIDDENITEITVTSNLDWAPIMPIRNNNDELIDQKPNIKLISTTSDIILIDD